MSLAAIGPQESAMKIDRNIPIPQLKAKRKGVPPLKAAIPMMEVGDSFLTDYTKLNSGAGAANLFAGQLGLRYKFTCAVDNGFVRVWRIA